MHFLPTRLPMKLKRQTYFSISRRREYSDTSVSLPSATDSHTLELRLSRYVGEGMHEAVDLTHFTQKFTSFELQSTRAKLSRPHYFSRTFSTWPIFFWTFPPIFSTWPSASKSGLFVARPTFSLTLPFTSWNLPFALSLVLCFMDCLLWHDLICVPRLRAFHCQCICKYHNPVSVRCERGQRNQPTKYAITRMSRTVPTTPRPPF